MRHPTKTTVLCLFALLLGGCDREATRAPVAPVDASPPAVHPPPPASAPGAAVIASAAPEAAALPNGPPPEVPRLTYERYANPRFVFAVDVPTFFHAEKAPANGDGQEWTWGDAATMTASGMNNVMLTADELCRDPLRSKRGVKGSSTTKTGCWVTGIDAGRIYWERTVLSGDFIYELSLSYDARLKKAFDPLIAHVNASWDYWKCDASRISACGLCTQRCTTTADCKGKREVCKPVTCPSAVDLGKSFGQGCVDPDDELSLRPGAFVLHDSE